MKIINFRLKGLTARLYESLGMRGQVSEAEQIFSKDAILSQKTIYGVLLSQKSNFAYTRGQT